MSSVITAPFVAEQPAVVKSNEKKRSNAASYPLQWKGWEKFLFRVAFVFFVFMSLPTSEEWYINLLNIDWANLHYRDLYDLARFSSGFSFVGNTIFGNSFLGYANWIITLAVALAIGLIWTLIDKKSANYNELYYWLRVIVRYRAGIGIIGFGFTKLFPVQMPYPSEGLLNTDFGDLTAQKIYWLSIGIVPWYQVFAGVVELTAGALLFFRKTTFLGAALLFGALGDIVYVNFAYDGGVHVYSSYFVLLAAFLMIQDIPVLYNYFIREKLTVPKLYYPDLSKGLRFLRFGLKSFTIFLFLGVLFYLQYVNFRYDPYKQPSMKGIAALRGTYDVEEFKLNGQTIPYSPLDSVRWQQATFEKWSTLTFKVNKPVQLDLSNGGGASMRDINRTFELTGVAGGQRVFYYDADTSRHLLFLQDKNTAGSRPRNRARNQVKDARIVTASSWIPEASLVVFGDEDEKIHEEARSTRRTRGIAQEKKEKFRRNRMVLQYNTVDGSKVILSGLNENNDSIYVVLNRIKREYLLSPGKLVAGSY